MMDIDSAQKDDMSQATDDVRRDYSLLRMNIVPVEAGSSIEIKCSSAKQGISLFLRTFETSHGGHPAQGYVVVSKKTVKTLKSDLRDLDSQSIGRMVRQGIKVHDIEEIENVEFCYTGDTSIEGLLSKQRPMIDGSNLIKGFEASLFLCEVTYLDEGYEVKAIQRGHMHVSHLKTVFNENWVTNKKDKILVLCHLSSAGGSIEKKLTKIFNSLPLAVANNTFVSISSFNHEHRSEGIWSMMSENGLISLKNYMKYVNK